MLERLARSCYSNRRKVLVGWILAFILLGVLGATAKGPFTTDYNTPGSESKAAQDLLKEKFPERAGDTIAVVFKANTSVDDPVVRQKVEQLLAKLSHYDHVVGVVSPYGPNRQSLRSSKGAPIAFGNLQLDVQGQSVPIAEAKDMIKQATAASDGRVTFELSGQAIQNAEFVNGSGSEGAGVLVALVILLITFGSLIAAGLPILTAVMGISIGLAITELLANVIEVPNFAPLVAAMVGIGVGIDYALFIVTRYRHGLHNGMAPEQAVVVALTTAGRAVVFAGLTVVISLMGLLLMNLPFLQGVAVGSAAAVLVTMLAAITLLPAMLGFAGAKIDRLKVPFIKRDEGDHRSGFWFRWSRVIQRRPWPALVAGLVIVGLLIIPMFSLRVGFPGLDSQPESRMTRRSYDLFVEGFEPGVSAPLILAADSGTSTTAAATLARALGPIRTDPGVAAVTQVQPNGDGTAAVVTVFPKSGGTSQATEDLVRRLRDDVIPKELAGSGVKVDIGGPNAAFIDSSESISSRLPIFIAVVVFLSFLLLMTVFRSILVALKAAIMNLLSIGAAYGVLVAVCQWGWMKDVFGISSTGPIASFIPMMMFAILFGLSMDYEVFLLSRVREEYVKTGDNGLAVADGLAATARVITAAAAIMICVFMAFVLGPELVIKQIGLGLAVAILIDATIIRMVLVPSTMELLGSANWWLPKWLDRILPTVAFEAPDEELDLDREMETLTAEAGRRDQ